MIRFMLPRVFALVFCVAVAACGGKDQPPTPNPGNPVDGIQVSGRERLGWSQPAADTVELAQLQYAVYVDNTRTTLTGATCGSTSSQSGFDCSAPLPTLSAGGHTLELVSFIADSSGILESGRSAPLRVFMTGTRAAGSTFASDSTSGTTTFITTAEGLNLNVERITDGLQTPSDIAFNSNGTIYIAERAGIIRVVKNGTVQREPALNLSAEVASPQGGLLGIALDPKFSDTGLMYALYAVGAPRGGLEFMLARFRSVADRFAERAILLDRVSASPDGASGALRVGGDGKLYVALDDAADRLIAGNFGSYNGKVLRLNPNATTPDDQTDFTPIYSPDHPQPKALDWQPVSGTLWVIDGVAPTGGRLSAVAAQNAQQRSAEFRTAYALPQGTGASSATFYRGDLISIFRGNLFVAAETGRQLMRMQFDSEMPTRMTSVEYFLKDEIGPVRVVAEGRDGALYVASDNALYRLAP
jgi:glucose/arabinose dehydrogenase